MTPPLVVVGALNMDAIIDVAHLPLAGETVVAAQPSVASLGGKGANQAAAAATFLGSADAVAMVGCIGDDRSGQQMIDDLRQRGVDVSSIRECSGTSGAATIAVDPQGENLVIVDPGANASLAAADVQVPLVAEADVLLLQLEVPGAAVRAAVDHALGRVVLNPAPADHAAPFIHDADVLIPNRSELAAMLGAQPAGSVDEILEQAKRLSARGDVVVTLGREGALVLRHNGHAELLGAPEVAAVDSTGAGDCFCGVLAALLAEGLDVVECARRAVVAASLSVLGRGARGNLPTRREVDSALPTSP